MDHYLARNNTGTLGKDYMDTLIFIIVGLLLIALVVFLVVRNLKDEKEVEEQIKSDYGRPHKHVDQEDPVI